MTDPDRPYLHGCSFAPIAIATRSGADESLHHGAGAVVAADGTITGSIGDPELMIYPRSALKPFQAAAMVAVGLDLPPRLLAVVTASHSGERAHLDAVTEILDGHGFTAADLANTPDRPFGAQARRASLADHVAPSALQQNCSGKHAAMLVTCRINGWPTESYLETDHPLQIAIRSEIDRLAGRSGGSVAHVGIDGCGAPTHLMPVVDLARALASMVRERSSVIAAMVAEPFFVGGSDRDVTLWMEAVPGLVAKEGAAGVMVIAQPDGRSAAVKIADGSDAARRAVTIEMLRLLGADVDRTLSEVRDRVAVGVRGHGVDVGSLAALPWT